MAIRVQYGPEGLALRAAQQAGEGQDFWRRHAAEQQMVQQAIAAREGQRQLDLQNRRLELERLKALQRQRLAASPTTQRRAPQMQMEQRGQAAFAAGFDEDARRQLEAAYQYGDRDTVNRLFQRVTDTGQPSPTAQATDQKLSYIQQISRAMNLPDEATATLASFAQSPDVDLNDLRLQAGELAAAARQQRGGLSPSEQVRYQLYGVRDQTSAIRQEMADLAAELEEQGIDPQGPPSQVVAEGPQAPSGFFGTQRRQYASAYDWIPGISARDASEFGQNLHPAAQKYYRLQELRRQLQDLQRQQQEIIGGGQPQPRQQQSRGPGQQQGWSIQRIE